MMSTASIVDNTGLLRTVLFPRAILPIGTVLFNFAQYLLTIAVFLPLMFAWYRIPLVAPMLLFPAVLVLHVAFTIGIALILATITVFFRDVRHLVEVALSRSCSGRRRSSTSSIACPRSCGCSSCSARCRHSSSPIRNCFSTGNGRTRRCGWWPSPMPSARSWSAALLLLAFEDRFTEQSSDDGD